MDDNNINEFIGKVNSVKGVSLADLSSGEDLSIALMNLISIEEHMYFSGMKTGDKKYFGLLDSVRRIRAGLLKELIGQPGGEVWCISKHLLGASMRLMEVGTKYHSNGKEDEAYEKYEQAFSLYSLFWDINLGPKVFKETALHGADKREAKLAGIREIVKKIIDCCREL